MSPTILLKRFISFVWIFRLSWQGRHPHIYNTRNSVCERRNIARYIKALNKLKTKHRQPLVLPALREKLKQFYDSLKVVVNGKLQTGSSNLSGTRLAREEPARRLLAVPFITSYTTEKNHVI